MAPDQKHADYVRSLREKTGMSRAQLAAKLGLSVRTIQMVEIAHQRLGGAALKSLEAMASSGIRDSGSEYAIRDLGEGDGVSQMRQVIRIMLRDESLAKGRAIAATAGCAIEDAMEFVVKNELKKGGP